MQYIGGSFEAYLGVCGVVYFREGIFPSPT